MQHRITGKGERSPSCIHERHNMQEKHVFISLIHGTWARYSTWPDEGSAIRNVLKQELGDQVEFCVPRWSGRNRDSDRDEAAKQLVNELRVKWKETPTRARYLVCHSHGGNIAIRAAAELQEELSGVICLNTPFINVMSQSVLWRLVTWIFVLIFAPVSFLAAWVPSLIESGGGTLVQELLYLMGIVVTAAVVASLLTKLGRSVRVRSQMLVRKMRPPRVPRCPILCVASANDEATFVLSLLEMLANLPAFAQHILILPVLLVVAILIQVFGWMPSITIGAAGASIWASAWLYLVALFVSLEVLGIGCAVLLRDVPLGLRLRVCKPLAHLAVRMAVTPVPLHFRLVDFADIDTAGTSFLAHSRIYADPEVLKLVAAWIANGARLPGDERTG